MRSQRSRFAARPDFGIRTIVRSDTTGTIRVAPSSVAFSIVQSQRDPFVTQANSVSGTGRGAEATGPFGRSAPPE